MANSVEVRNALSLRHAAREGDLKAREEILAAAEVLSGVLPDTECCEVDYETGREYYEVTHPLLPGWKLSLVYGFGSWPETEPEVRLHGVLMAQYPINPSDGEPSPVVGRYVNSPAHAWE